MASIKTKKCRAALKKSSLSVVLRPLAGKRPSSKKEKRTGASDKKRLLADALREQAKGDNLARGRDYFANGAVKALTQIGQRVSAAVQGTHLYKAFFWMENSALRYECSCPAGGFCKHLDAVALAFNAGGADVLDDADEPPAPTGSAGSGQSKTRSRDLRTHLMAQSKEHLVGRLMELADRDSVLREGLKLDAATANPAGVDMNNFRRCIDRGLNFPDVSYDYGPWDDDEDGGDDGIEAMDRFGPVLKALEKIFAQGHAVSAASLAEYAMTKFEKVAYRLEEDPDAAGEIMKRLCSLHIKAAQTAAPDPEALAEWIFRRILMVASADVSFPWESYRLLLGSAGMTRFRSRVEAARNRPPDKTKNGRSYDESNERRVLKEIMAAFACDGDGFSRAKRKCSRS